MTHTDHSAAERVAAACHDRDTKAMLAEFDKFMDTMSDKYPCVILPYYRIAEYCLDIENRRSYRVDVLTIKSTMKKED